MMGFKKILVELLGDVIGQYVAQTMIAQYIFKHKIIDIENKSESYKKEFVDDLLSRNLSKFLSKDRIGELKERINNNLFSTVNPRGDPVLPERDLYSNDIAKEPLDFIVGLFGKNFFDMMMEKYDHEGTSFRDQVMLAEKIIETVFEEFYTPEKIKTIKDNLIEFIKGRYEFKKINKDDPVAIHKVVIERYLRKNDDKDEAVIERDVLLKKLLVGLTGYYRTNTILKELRDKHKVYSLKWAGISTRKHVYNLLIKDYLKLNTSVARSRILAAKLQKILGLDNDIL